MHTGARSVVGGKPPVAIPEEKQSCNSFSLSPQLFQQGCVCVNDGCHTTNAGEWAELINRWLAVPGLRAEELPVGRMLMRKACLPVGTLHIVVDDAPMSSWICER